MLDEDYSFTHAEIVALWNRSRETEPVCAYCQERLLSEQWNWCATVSWNPTCFGYGIQLTDPMRILAVLNSSVQRVPSLSPSRGDQACVNSVF